MPKHPRKDRRTKFDLEPFPYIVHVIVSDNVAEAVRTAQKEMGGVPDDSGAGVTGALTLSSPESTHTYVILPFECCISWIAHEVFHVVRNLMLLIGAKLEHENEVMAYYIGHLTKELAKFNYDVSQPIRRKKKIDKMSK